MNAHVNALPAGEMNTKPLWAAVGVLGMAVVALGASLVYVQTRPLDGHAALAAIGTPPLAEVAAASTRVAAPAAKTTSTATPRPAAAKPAPHPVAAPSPAPAPAPVAAAPAPVAAPAPAPAPVQVANNSSSGGAPSVVTDSGVLVSQPVQTAPRVVCSNCGTVEAVTPIQRNAREGSGVGVVAGGVLGAVVGNQIGKGSGRTLATVLGAVGGGLAGNAIEKNMKKETVYEVQVRMEDGSLRTLEQTIPASIGARVTVDGNRLSGPDAQSRAPAQPLPAARPVTVATTPPELNR
jgi:outer membrane lipoprotein SlyB